MRCRSHPKERPGGGMKRVRIDLDRIADLHNLARAAYLAGRGKRHRPEVMAFFTDLDQSLARLAAGIRNGTRPLGIYHPFTVRDPKRRLIHAACFEDRVLHHAVFAQAGPVLERAMVDSSCACRVGKGPLAAVEYARSALHRYPWYVKTDIRAYFASIDHERLLALLRRRFKGAPFLALLQRIVESYGKVPGRGLPIGSLSSQHFANYYLDALDRLLLQGLGARAHVRYMDDLLWWCDDSAQARATLAQVKAFAKESLMLEVKETAQINRSRKGVTFCGYRILSGTLRLSRRRQRSYQDRRRQWEHRFLAGDISARELQQAYDAVHTITLHADSRGWRSKNLARFPALDV